MNEVLSFDDEAQAYGEIEAMGYHAMEFDFPAEENELHWHDFDSVLYVTGGELTVWVDGEDDLFTCHRGAKIVAAKSKFVAAKLRSLAVLQLQPAVHQLLSRLAVLRHPSLAATNQI